jgi:hypothetical protein
VIIARYRERWSADLTGISLVAQQLKQRDSRVTPPERTPWRSRTCQVEAPGEKILMTGLWPSRPRASPAKAMSML